MTLADLICQSTIQELHWWLQTIASWGISMHHHRKYKFSPVSFALVSKLFTNLTHFSIRPFNWWWCAELVISCFPCLPWCAWICLLPNNVHCQILHCQAIHVLRKWIGYTCDNLGSHMIKLAVNRESIEAIHNEKLTGILKVEQVLCKLSLWHWLEFLSFWLPWGWLVAVVTELEAFLAFCYKFLQLLMESRAVNDLLGMQQAFGKT